MPLTDPQRQAAREARPSVRRWRPVFGSCPCRGKWWRFKYRFGGKEKRISLGVYPEVTLK